MKTIKELEKFQCVRDVKLYFMCEYNNNVLSLRKEVPFNKNDINHFQYDNESGEYIIRKSRRGAILGKCVAIDDAHAKITKVYIHKTNDYVEDLNKLIVQKTNNYNNYIKKYFKVYYDLIVFCTENYKESYYKVTALKFYQLIKSLFNQSSYFNNRYVFSEPNCFVLDKKNGREYDALILKKGIDINQGFYSLDDIVATIELKGGGYIAKRSNLKRIFKKYIGDEAIKNIPHIYISIYESSVDGKKSNYSRIIDGIEKIRKKDIYIKPFIISTKETNQEFMESVNCSVEEILDFIEKVRSI